MSSVIESEIPQYPSTCCYCEEEETCGCLGKTVCCQHTDCACHTEEVVIGNIVQIDFLDHAQDSENGPLFCTVYGSVTDLDDNYITVASWQTHGGDFESTTFTIVTSCISSLVVLQPSHHNDRLQTEADDATHCGGQSITLNPTTDTSD